MKDCPFEAWQLIQASEVLKWFKRTTYLSLGKNSFVELVEDVLFNLAYEKLGLKPIGKCTIQELQEELNKRLGK